MVSKMKLSDYKKDKAVVISESQSLRDKEIIDFIGTSEEENI